MESKGNILIAEDDAAFAAQLASLLEAEGYRIFFARDGREALNIIGQQSIDVGLLDLAMPGMDGMEVLHHAHQEEWEVPLIVITGHASIDRAVHATRMGAFDFLEKPVDADRVLLTVERAVEKHTLARKSRWMAAEIMNRYRMVGTSAVMQRVYQQIEQVAATDSTVLITGETGTGKELVAMAIHMRSRRASEPLVGINCAAIPDTLIESELFGYKKGAFTGAVDEYEGKLAAANHGTLFLDEIADLTLSAQAKLLRVLQSHEFERIGENKPRQVDVRVLAATNKNLQERVAQKLFREDLFFRVCVVDIYLPPLRQRKEDIPDLANYFVKQFCESYNRYVEGISPAALRRMMEYHWPGNVRQLRSVIERALIMSTGPVIEKEAIHFSEPSHTTSAPVALTLRGQRKF